MITAKTNNLVFQFILNPKEKPIHKLLIYKWVVSHFKVLLNYKNIGFRLSSLTNNFFILNNKPVSHENSLGLYR